MLYNKDWAYKLNPVADTLFKAADLLEKRGHTKYTASMTAAGCVSWGYFRRQGHEHGYVLAEFDSEITVEASRVVAQTLGLKLRMDDNRALSVNDYRGAVVDWNNRPERTAKVIDAMRKTASELMEKAHAV